MSIFIDTSAFLAILNKEDHFHQIAKRTWEEVNLSEEYLICSNYVIIETISLLQKRFGIEALRIFENEVRPIIDIIWIDQTIHHAGMVVVLTTNQRKLSLVDCTSFEILRNIHVEKVFTLDSHFSEQGFNIIPELN
ncbi:MAG: VapC toxin family PIN domain ribonuclease [Chloroflexi bacterium HGW-Chloroflexi-3]|nr:MAG: VapC toxin family PIN domain ribonuclease [Chloroflexi bacterium HGW-Chloroflexi-3]